MLELKDAIEMISVQHSIATEEVVNLLKDTIKNEFSEFLNAFEEDIIVDIDDEEYKVNISIMKEVINTPANEFLEISLVEAKKIFKEEDLKIGVRIKVPLSFEVLKRKDIKRLNFILKQKIRNIKNEILYRDYKNKEGELINGIFLRRRGQDMFIDIGKIEACLPFREQSFREKYKQGDHIKTYIKEVVMDERQMVNIYVSRVDANIVRKLFELEIPELADGSVKIKEIVRDPGKKIKMSVYSTKIGVEPVGSCVGVSGIRIKAVIKELWGERIDVVPYNDNIKEFIGRAMQPGKVINVLIINEDKKECLVIVDDESYPFALGKDGVNIKLASHLTGWNISVRSESQVKKYPDLMKIFSRAENLFSNVETDLNQLTEIDESVIVKLMNAGIMSIADLYEKSVEEINRLENISKEEATLIRKTLDEMVEIVDEDEKPKEIPRPYLNRDERGYSPQQEVVKEEVEHVEYLVCPSCDYEFEYENQKRCPSCDVEFEFEEEN